MMSDVPAANVEARSTPEHDRAVVLDRIQAAAELVGAACDVHPASHAVRVLVTGTYTQITRMRALLPRDVFARAEVIPGTMSASLRWVL
jgi:hypothetical protein